ncbi:hypothetical protein [Actinomadura miaoliensis]
MRFGTWAGLVLAVGVLAGCSGESDSPPVASSRVASPPVASSPVGATAAPEAPEASTFRGCLQRRGIRLPEDEHKSGDEERMRTAIEACASLLTPGEAVRIPVVKGSAFQTCLERHGVKLPAPGQWLSIDRGEDRVMDAALKRC